MELENRRNLKNNNVKLKLIGPNSESRHNYKYYPLCMDNDVLQHANPYTRNHVLFQLCGPIREKRDYITGIDEQLWYDLHQ